MKETTEAYGDLVRFDIHGNQAVERLARLPVGVPAVSGGVDEDTLRNVLFNNPQALPIRDIDSAYVTPIPLCKELSTGAGLIDAVFANSHGRLILAEFKLWRNPQARREVIGQILDYAKELASWDYEDLQSAVAKNTKRSGNAVYEIVHATETSLIEHEFVDRVTRHLKRGEFLLLIVGDGIREGVEDIVDFVQSYSGLHFKLALVEAAMYRDSDDRLIVQPRVLARTEIVQRFVLETEPLVEESEDGGANQSEYDEENLRFWTAVLRNYKLQDSSMDMPEPTNGSTLFFKVRHSGYGDWGLSYGCAIYRRGPSLNCYVTCRRNVIQAERIYSQLVENLEELKVELGEDLRHWLNLADRPRIGFSREQPIPFPTDHSGKGSFDDAVQWIQTNFNRLVNATHPFL